jgi:hypothetical protein
MAPPSLPDLESPRPSSSGTMAPPPLPHIKSHLLAGHAEVVLVATGRAEPISSSPPPGGSAIAQPAAQPPITPVVGAGVHDASGDPLHHTTLLTPLPSILPKGHSWCNTTIPPGKKDLDGFLLLDCRWDFRFAMFVVCCLQVWMPVGCTSSVFSPR